MILNKPGRMVQRVLNPAVVILVLIVSACSRPPANESPATTASPIARKITSVGVVKAEPQPVESAAGETTAATIRITIEKGFHLNANPPTYPYLKATELTFKPADGIKIGKVTYPPAVTQKFDFAEQPLAVYEGEKEIKAEISSDKTAAKGSRNLTAVLSVQACDDRVCYPPGTIDLQIPLTVK